MSEVQLESWRRVFRDGIAPLLSTKGLLALKSALEEDDPRLIQGATCTPPPLQCVQDWPIEAGCLITFCAAVDLGGFLGAKRPATVGEAEEQFARTCFECDARLGEPAACRWALSWFDESSREEMIEELLPEVERELIRRTSLGPNKE